MKELPNEIISYILSYLDTFEDALSVSLVARRFRELIRYTPLLRIDKIFIIRSYEEQFILNCKKYFILPIKDNRIVDRRQDVTFRGKIIYIEDIQRNEINYDLFVDAKSLYLDTRFLTNIPESFKTIKNLHFVKPSTIGEKEFEILGTQKYLFIPRSLISQVLITNNMKRLILTGCKDIIDFSFIAKCHKLIELDLSFTRIKDLSFTSFSHIKYLNLSYTDIEDITNLEDVENLRLIYCKRIWNFSVLGKQNILDVSYTYIYRTYPTWEMYHIYI